MDLDARRAEWSKWVIEQIEEEEIEKSYWDLFSSMIAYKNYKRSAGGSRKGKRPNIDRERATGHERIWRDYFAPTPVYSDMQFRSRFRMRRELFLRIHDSVVAQDHYFQQKCDALGVLGLSSIQKVTAAIRMLAYGKSADELDEYIRIGESTAMDCLKRFCLAVVALFKEKYLRAPTASDLERILQYNATRGFPGMMGSIDYIHWAWKNCPKSWAVQSHGEEVTPTIVLEAVASYDLWIWYAFFGIPGPNNDVNVLDRSPLFKDLVEGVGPSADYQVNGNQYNMCYMLADGIYPKWPTFMQTISEPQNDKSRYFAMMQESARKDVKRCFELLQSRWATVRNPARLWSRKALSIVMTTCIILHNMIVEDERDDEALVSIQLQGLPPVMQRGGTMRDTRLVPMVCSVRSIRDGSKFYALQNDLIEHLWAEKS